ncbi:MAG: hypothetical protein OXN81_05775, partial [Alphaproteobacteria bacterium]|nr:hypothetical protein [Alphaproteobacteria bacterium]
MDTVKDTIKPWLAPAVIVAVFALGLAPVYVMLDRVHVVLDRIDGKIDSKIDSVRTELKGDIRELGERLD